MSDGGHFLSMEFVDGEAWARADPPNRTALPGEKADEQLLARLCAGLAAAHAKGVLHRDLKPQNVMLDGKGRVGIHRTSDWRACGGRNTGWMCWARARPPTCPRSNWRDAT